MSDNDDLWLEAFDEVMGETVFQKTRSVSSYRDEIGPMPDESLILGRVPSDGLPLMLNLHDPTPGNILLISDFENSFLVSIAIASSYVPRLSIGIVTHRTGYWEPYTDLKGVVGVFPVYDRSSENFILSLASWAYGQKNSKESVLLLFDEMKNIAHMEMGAVQNLRWLLNKGPLRRVWTISTMYSNSENVSSWKDSFLTHFLGVSETTFTFMESGNPVDAEILEPR